MKCCVPVSSTVWSAMLLVIVYCRVIADARWWQVQCTTWTRRDIRCTRLTTATRTVAVAVIHVTSNRSVTSTSSYQLSQTQQLLRLLLVD